MILVMLHTSVTRDEYVKAVFSTKWEKFYSADQFFGKDKDPEVIRKKFESVIAENQAGLQEKKSVYMFFLLVILNDYYSGNILDITYEQLLELPDFGYKKAGIVDENHVGLDTHLKGLIVKKWKWTEEKNDKLQHQIVTDMFCGYQKLIPDLNSSIVSVCQLFQAKEELPSGEKKELTILGVIFLELLAVLNDGIYEKWVDLWYEKEKEISKNKHVYRVLREFSNKYHEGGYVNDTEREAYAFARELFGKYELHPREYSRLHY